MSTIIRRFGALETGLMDSQCDRREANKACSGCVKKGLSAEECNVSVDTKDLVNALLVSFSI